VENESRFDFVSSAFVEKIMSPFSFTVRSLGEDDSVILVTLFEFRFVV